jgi:signal transduction histidine kinase
MLPALAVLGYSMVAANPAGRGAAVGRAGFTLFLVVAGLVIYWLVRESSWKRERARLGVELAAARRESRAKDELVAQISHDLRTPLTGIYGFSEYLLAQQLQDPGEAMELLGLIYQDSAESTRMVEDLLTAARLDSQSLVIERTPVDMLEEAETVVAPLLRSGASIELRGTREVVMADAMRIRQVIRNLLSRAIRHGEPNIGIVVTARSGIMTCTVTDDGPGLDPVVADRLISGSPREQPVGLLTERAGLGLAIAASLAQRMGGVLQHATDRQQTTIILAMPLAPADAWDAFPTRDRRVEGADPTARPLSNRFTIDTANAADAPAPSPEPKHRIRFG